MTEWTAPNQRGVPGYEGTLNKRFATLPQLLQGAGYHTYMVGKWHLGKQPDQIPRARGFERDFSLLDGGGSYWGDMKNVTAVSPKLVFTEDGRYLTRLPDDYYATKTYTDKLIGYIDANKADGKPFFAYVAHQAPHDPYHLPKDWRNRDVGKYDKGWDAVRAGAAEATDRDGHHARGHGALRAHVVRARPDAARAGCARPARQEDGAVRRHGREHGPPHRAARRPPEEDRRVREHHLRLLRRQRRRGLRPFRDDRRQPGFARLPLRGGQLERRPISTPGATRVRSSATGRCGRRSR
ncbi:MAG: sulfatase-like hydrolase/transferase [Candidatus Moduliflexus flocculans]|nr:sulfatase-like hydrolase/transferase [Candidatus Moduliflexus flocculans]